MIEFTMKAKGWNGIGQPFPAPKGPMIKVACGCGNVRDVRISDLARGNSLTCGCYSYKKYIRRLNRSWSDMMLRCYDDRKVGYHRYGGRGITVCDEWHQYTKFHDWALANGYTDDLTIDRIDNNGRYEPSNCRWVTRAQQIQNSTKAKLTEDQVREIKAKLRAGARMNKIAREYGMGLSAIHEIKHGISWKNVD